MKQKITKGKVIRNCLQLSAAIVVAGGVGFQFHENHQLNSDLTTLKNDHKETVQKLEDANKSNKQLEKNNKEMKETTDKLNNDIKCLKEKEKTLKDETNSLKEQAKSLKEANKKLEQSKKELQGKLQEEREYPSRLKTKTPTKNSSKTKTKSSTTVSSNTSNKVVQGVGTAYTSSCAGCTGTTASGKSVSPGMVAMDQWVPLGTKVKITCPEYPQINGVYNVEDRGGAIHGNRVDIYMTSHSEAVKFGKRDIKIEILN
ncbi:3D domain-containing protein [Bacillus inaquosorum]|uniref:3D domain-containing protein n=1 Tax=Bacillus inaquosorum TaxID=483913 RepID=UPI00227FCA7C|nr:3D domain-containing protein [Bacillus inaquosorum]MCY9308821.1 3D domain-containing protein [Bacillus inaquosorum]